jgi:large conductance mechanosensitive channel
VIAFVLVAIVIYFFVVLPFTALVARFHKEPEPDPTIRKCPECMSEIPIDARRCAFCGELVRETKAPV